MIIQRTILANIWQNIENNKILLLNGARQVGKSTILDLIEKKLISEKKINPKNIIRYDLEKTSDLEIWSKQSTTLATLPNNQEKYFIFIDEFQKSKSIGSILKVLHDHHPNFKIIITGSATWYLNIDESLAGRKIVFPVWTLSFSEFLSINDKLILDKIHLAEKNIKSLTNSNITEINNKLIEFLRYGAYPEVVLTEESAKAQILSDLLNSYLTRDIQLWNYAINTLQLKHLMTILAGQIGSLLEISSLCKNSAIGRTALVNRLELLQNTFITTQLKPFFTNKIKELTKNPKLYFNDLGLRNMLMENFSIKAQTSEFGGLAENFVALEFLKNKNETDNLFYWRTPAKQEVDFIIKREDKLIPAEVKSGNETKVPSSLKSFIHKYSPETAYVLNWSEIKEEQIDKTKVLFRPLWWKI